MSEGAEQVRYDANLLPPRLVKEISFDGYSRCWKWDRWRDKLGYGRTNVNRFGRTGPSRSAYSVVWEVYHGPVDPGYALVFDHLCRVTCCVNPAHLERVTQGENVRRGWEHRKDRKSQK